MNEESKTEQLLLSKIDITTCLLRSAKRQDLKFGELKASIKEHGVNETILVRINPDPTSDKPYVLIDGLQRYTCSIELGKDSIPALIKDPCTDEEAFLLQLEMNLQGIKTLPGEFARMVKMIQEKHPTFTTVRIADMLNTNVKWVRDRLKLDSLPPEVLDLIDIGEITVGNGITLAKLPEGDVFKYLDDAKKLKVVDFNEVVTKRVKQLYTKNIQEKPEEWVPKPRFTDMGLISRELASEDTPYFKKVLGKEPTDKERVTYKQALLIAVSLDHIEVARRKEAFQVVEKAKEKRDLERERAVKAEKKLALEAQLRAIDRQLDN